MVAQSLFGRVAIGGFAGAIFGFFDVAIFLGNTSSELSSDQCRRAIFIALLLGMMWGCLLSIPLSLIARWFKNRWTPSTLNVAAGLLVILGYGGAYIDATLYVNLYADLHWFLGGLSLLISIFGALLLTINPHVVLNGCMVILTVLSPLAARLLLTEHVALAQMLMEQTTVTGRTVSVIWSAPERQISEDCTWPMPTVPNITKDPTNASILLITVDAWRADLAEHHLEKAMPLLAERSRNAVYFPRAYAASTRTHESIYSLMTGTWPHRLNFSPAGVDKNDQFRELDDSYSIKQTQLLPLHDTHTTIAQRLSEAGYATAAIIPYVFFMKEAGITRGFDHIDARAYLEANKVTRGVTSPILTTQTIAWVSKQNTPWMTWIHYLDPHNPYIPFGVPPTASMKVKYLSELRRVDVEIDRLLTTLEAQGALDNTWVIIASDHGEEFKDHGGNFHGATVYEELARVPLFIWGPGLKPAKMTTPISLIDIMPTTLELVGLRAQNPMDGQSFAASIDNRSHPIENGRPLLVSSGLGDKKVAVIQGHTKYILNLGNQGEQLFDLSDDPGEKRNLLDERQADVIRAQCLLRASGILEDD